LNSICLEPNNEICAGGYEIFAIIEENSVSDDGILGLSP
jgi:hypothetical protein